MNQIVDVKLVLNEKTLLSILAESVYNPTEERLNSRADKYRNNPNTAVFAAKDSDAYVGIIIVDVSNINSIEILGIAVSVGSRKSGIGSSLINHCIHTFHPKEIIAETDDDAVGFYERFGFDIVPLGDKYGAGIMRYLCTYEGR